MPLHPDLFDKLNTELKIVTDDPEERVIQGGAGVAIQHGSHILYAILDESRYVTLLLNNLTDYQHSGRFETLNTWTRIKIKDQVPSTVRAGFKVEYAMSITSLGEYVYLFWRAADGEHRALRVRPEFISQYEVATLGLSNIEGSHVGNVAGFRLPAALPSLDGKLGLVGTTRLNTGDSVLVARVLDPADFNPRSTWTAKDLSGNAAVRLGNNSNLEKYSHLTASWVDQGQVVTEETDTPKPSASLIVHLHNDQNASPSIISVGMDLPALFDGAYRADAGASIGLKRITGLDDLKGLGATFYTAPDGQLWTQYASNAKTLAAKLILNTTGSGKPGLHSPKWEPTDPFPGQKSKAKAYNTPYTVMLPLMPSREPSPCAVPQPRDAQGHAEPPKVYENSDVQPFVACVLSSDEAHRPLLSTFLWGQTFRIPNYIVSEIVSEKQATVQLTMVADTFPVPVPASALWGEDSPSGMVNWALATYDYLVGEDSSVELDYELSSSFGYKSGGNAMVFGVGAQSEISLIGGFETLATEGQQKFRASTLSVSTKGIPPATALRPDGEHLNIVQEGAYFGMTPPTKIGVDAYGTLPRGMETPGEVSMAGVHPDLSDGAIVGRNGTFSTYLYRPGDLLSYDVAAINARMREQYNTLRPDEQERLVIDGEDFRPYYSDGNYVNRIVERFGNQGLGPSGGRPYLEFAFSETTIGRSEFQSTSSFTDGATTFVDASWYLGLGWDQSFTLGGGPVIVELSAGLFSTSGFAMVGTGFSSRLTTREGGATSWGLRLGEFLNPLASGEAYTTRMYLLKPSRLWAVEMALFGGADPEIDVATSSPVRILFTVPYLSDALRARLAQLPD